MQLGMIGLGRMGGNMVRYRYDLDLAETAELWRRGSVVGSWLLDLTYARFRSRQDHTFADKVLSAMRHKFGGHVESPSQPALAAGGRS